MTASNVSNVTQNANVSQNKTNMNMTQVLQNQTSGNKNGVSN